MRARDASGVFYPLVERAGLLTTRDAQHALEVLGADVADYSGGRPHDDVAMLVVRHLAPGAHGPWGATAVR